MTHLDPVTGTAGTTTTPVAPGTLVEAPEMAKGELSPKTILATLLPFIGTLIAVGVQWVVTGEFDKAETVTAITGGAAALAALLGGYAGKPGLVVAGKPVP